MSAFTLTIGTDNAAFDEDPAPEVARILAKLVTELEQGSLTGFRGGLLRDVNGNTVGDWTHS